MYQEIFEALPEILRLSRVDMAKYDPCRLQDAWFWADVLKVFDWCRENNYAILGGDVMLLSNPTPLAIEAEDYGGNWSLDPLPGQTWSSYVEACYQHSYAYVTNYPKEKLGEVVFAPVVSNFSQFSQSSRMFLSDGRDLYV